MIVGVLTTCHTQYTWDSSMCIFLFNRTTLQVFVTYLTGALYVHPLWFYKHQHDNRVRSKLFVACQRWWFQWRFTAILVNCAPSGEMHNYCTPHIIKENFENFLIHRCNYVLLSQVYCVWQVVKTPTIIFNNPVLLNAKVVKRTHGVRGSGCSPSFASVPWKKQRFNFRNLMSMAAPSHVSLFIKLRVYFLQFWNLNGGLQVKGKAVKYRFFFFLEKSYENFQNIKNKEWRN